MRAKLHHFLSFILLLYMYFYLSLNQKKKKIIIFESINKFNYKPLFEPIEYSSQA